MVITDITWNGDAVEIEFKWRSEATWDMNAMLSNDIYGSVTIYPLRILRDASIGADEFRNLEHGPVVCAIKATAEQFPPNTLEGRMFDKLLNFLDDAEWVPYRLSKINNQILAELNR